MVGASRYDHAGLRDHGNDWRTNHERIDWIALARRAARKGVPQ